MTDTAFSPQPSSGTTEDIRQKRLAKRRAAERRFKAYGQVAILIAISALFVILSSIASQAASAVSRHYLNIDVSDAPAVISSTDSDQRLLNTLNQTVRNKLSKRFPEVAANPAQAKQLYSLTSELAVLPTLKEIKANTENRTQFRLALPDDADLFLKGGVTGFRRIDAGQVGRISKDGDRYTLSPSKPDDFRALQALFDETGQPTTSILIDLGQTTYRIERSQNNLLVLSYLTGRKQGPTAQSGVPVKATVLKVPENSRTLSDRQIAWIFALKDDGLISKHINWSLITHSDSTYPELAGAAAAIIGSLLTLFLTAMLAIPIGIFAALYLEEFAPRNRITSLIEVNINNLAAVPSIIFGLLGAAVFLNIFGMPRSIPLVGGLVLGLLVLPTVIIASRAALNAVPQSIRTAALGLGASKTQSVFHHVLPYAAPGIVTGVILAMARALGETAPLLLIGMVAFVNEVPNGPNDEATALPVLIYKWFSGAERAWEPMTAGIILILLAILIAMNLIAVIVRNKFERKL